MCFVEMSLGKGRKAKAKDSELSVLGSLRALSSVEENNSFAVDSGLQLLLCRPFTFKQSYATY